MKASSFSSPLWASSLPFSLYCSVQFSRSVMSDSATPWFAARQASLSITNSQSSLRLMSIESVMPSSHLIVCRPLLLLPPIPPSIRVFSSESTLHEVAKHWSFQLYHHFFQRNPRADLLQNSLVGFPCSPRDSQESSPTPQFKSIRHLHKPELLRRWHSILISSVDTRRYTSFFYFVLVLCIKSFN